MNDHDKVSEMLPFYVSGALEAHLRQAVEKHLLHCPACQSDLALWKAVSSETISADLALAAPHGLADRALGGLRAGRARTWSVTARLGHAWLLLRSQAPLVHGEIWLASALVVGLGFIAALLSDETAFIYVLAPLVSAACLSFIYGPESDPSLELALSTPTSPRQILLARLALVYGYNLGLALVAFLGLLPFLASQPSQALLGSLLLSWLAPMTFLSAAALVLSLWIGASNAITATYLAWLVQVLAGTLRSPQSPVNLPPAFLDFLAAYQGFWGSAALLLALSALLFGTAVWFAGWKCYYSLNLA